MLTLFREEGGPVCLTLVSNASYDDLDGLYPIVQKELLMISFDKLADKARAGNPESDTDLLRRAYDFSVAAHAGQTRRSGEPYATHPLEVASLVAEMRLDDVAIAAGLLHDVVEDTLTSIDRVRAIFGPEVAHVVEGVTKISTIPFSSTE